MKKLVFIIGLLGTFFASAQTTIADKIVIRKSLILAGDSIIKIQKDSNFSSNFSLPTSAAVAAYIANPVKRMSDSISAHNSRINNKWSLTGDNITAGNFIGTTNDQDLVFKRYGSFAGYIDSVSKNTFFGVGVNQPGANTINNTANGYYALHSNRASYNNVANGTYSLQSLIGNDQNTATGAYSGAGVAQSFGSTYIGFNAGSAVTDHHYYSTFLGWNAGSTQMDGGNNIFIGANTQPNISTTNSNQLNIGNWIYGDSGKVGIGVKNPDSTFQVLGGLKFVTGRQGAGKVLVSDSNGGADWQPASAVGGGQGSDINGEIADYSSNRTITLSHLAINSSVKIWKNGQRLPNFKFNYSNGIITLMDTRIFSDIFLTDYKF